MARRRILIVDDDPSLLALLRILLISAGYEVVSAADGNQALAITQSDAFDIILLDLEMPGMNGREFFHTYAQRTGAERAPVVVLSAYGAEAGRRELGVEGHVAKPFDPPVVARVVSQVLAKSDGHPTP